MSRTARRRRRPSPDAVLAVVLALLVTGPLLLGPGYWLIGDMVFVPQQPWKSSWLGLDGALPRAVPMDAVMSLLTQVVPGSVVQRLLLLGGLVVGGLGVARLVAEQRWYARAAAITLFCWNPWVYERLLIGQWAILLGYLLLPWVVRAGLLLRADPRQWGQSAVVLVASATCSPSSGVMAAGVLLVMSARRDLGTWLRAVGLGVAANLTWLVPALTAAKAAQVSTDGVFEAFAARAESAAGTAASVLSLGGIWKTSIIPGERTSAALVLLSCLLSVVALLGLRRSRDRGRWAVLAATALTLALLPTLPGGAQALDALAAQVPGLALLRDSHRFLAPFGLVVAVGAAHAVSGVAERVRPDRPSLWGVVALIVVAPLLLLPSLAWGALGELQRSSYPPAWAEIAELVGPDDITVVLPWEGSYRGYDWNHRRAVLDPAPRLLPGQVLVDDRVLLDGREVPAEDPRVRAVGEALDATDPAAALRELGVRWVLVQHGMVEVTAPAGRTAYHADGLELLDLADHGEITAGVTPVRLKPSLFRQVLVTISNFLVILLLLRGFVVILHTSSNERHTT